MEWKTVKLGEVCNLLTGFPFKGNLYAKDGIRVLRGENIGDKELHFDGRNDKRWNLPFDKIEQYSLREGDIVMQMDGNVGKNKARLLHDDIPMLIAQRVACLREKEGVSDQRYLYFVITGTPFHQYLDSVKTGTSIQHISLKQIGDFELPLPPLETQRRIAAILSSLDDKIENNNRINRNLEAQAQALFKSWFVDFEPWGGTMPEDWKEGTLGEIVTVKRGGSPRPIQDYLSDKGYRWLKISDATAEASPFISHIVEHIKEEGLNKTVFIKQGSLVLSNSATPGLPKFVDLDTCIHDGWLYFPQSYFPNEYLYLLFQRERSYLLSQGNGSVFTNLKTDIVKNLSVTIPAEDVLNSFQKIIGKLFMEILNNQRENHRLAALRDTLLPKLMKGEIIL